MQTNENNAATNQSMDRSLAGDEFTRGVLDVVRQLCATLIGRGVIGAADLQDDMERLAKFWSEKEIPGRAEPARILVGALKQMARVKREVDVSIFRAPGVN